MITSSGKLRPKPVLELSRFFLVMLVCSLWLTVQRWLVEEHLVLCKTSVIGEESAPPMRVNDQPNIFDSYLRP